MLQDVVALLILAFELSSHLATRQSTCGIISLTLYPLKKIIDFFLALGRMRHICRKAQRLRFILFTSGIAFSLALGQSDALLILAQA